MVSVKKKALMKKYSKIVSTKFKGPLKNLVDPYILDPVLELNERGFRTDTSCAGNHMNGTARERQGYIKFKKKLTKSQITIVKEILTNYGLKKVIVGKESAFFSPVGGPKPPGWIEYSRKTDLLIDKMRSID